jgi:hypothetical protein
MGLSRKHHGELNRGASRARYDQLRREYAGDSVAQQQIDVYDGSTSYHDHLRSLRDAYANRDKAAIHREEAWFRRNYPDV